MAPEREFPKLAPLKTPARLRERLAALELDLPVDDVVLTRDAGSPLAEPITVLGRALGNRWCIHPMEGWDGTEGGAPSELTHRRWRHFGQSGAKLIWGGEAVAVRHDGRANPNQLLASEATKSGLAALRQTLVAAHAERHGTTGDLLVGLQLTHSGRFCRPNEKTKPEPRVLFHHPLLDARVGIAPDDDSCILSDEAIDRLIDDFVRAAGLAKDVGFDFVDVKACHGYLGHELLAAHTRPGRYGGGFENRTRFLREVIGRIQADVPGLGVGVRFSAFDFLPFEDDPASRTGRLKGYGRPMAYDGPADYPYAFCGNVVPTMTPELGEAMQLLDLLRSLGVTLVNVSCGSPYYNPHIQRPALYPPSDGYRPPEDPLVGVVRQIQAVRRLKAGAPDIVVVGSGYTYLQEFLPLVGQAVVRAGWVDCIGIGRMVLSYPEMPADSLAAGRLDAKRICRTFSDCTTGPRNGLVSGCYPLDNYYKQSDAGSKLRAIKAGRA